MNKPTIFVSYSWNDNYYANRICDDLKIIGFEIVRDTDVLGYRESISKFMKRISTEDFVLLLISDSYLKSTACMKEVLELGIENCIKDFVLPIVVDDAEIFNNKNIKYIDYWENKVKQRNEELSKFDPCNNISEYQKLKIERNISENVSSFITKIQDILLCSPEELWREKYRQIINKANINIDYEKLFGLRNINQTDLYNLFIRNADFLRTSVGEPVDLSRYDLRNKVLVGKDIDLSGINFRYSRLSTAYLVGAELVGCCFMGADLRGANLTYANLCDSDLRGANLVGIKYDGIRIRNADFSHAIMDSNFKQFVLEHGM